MLMDTMASEERTPSKANGPKYMSDARWPWRASLKTFKWTRLLLVSKGTLGVKAFRNRVTLIVKSGDRQLSVVELLIVLIPTRIVVILSKRDFQ
jgi:hypothetical protein